MPLKPWKKLSQKTFYKNDHWSYNIDEFVIGNGDKKEYHYVHTPGSSMVIPVTSSNKLVMVKQYRYLNQKESFEFPCGAVEEGLSYKENALKELREEAGYEADELTYIGEFSPYTGASDEMCKVFIGKDLKYSPLPKDPTEEFEVVEFSFEEIENMIEENIIWDGLTLSAWILAKKLLREINKR